MKRMSWVVSMMGVMMGLLMMGSLHAAPLPTLVMGSHVVQTDAPFVTRGRVTYAPIRDIARVTRSQLQYVRHLDAFQMTCPSPAITIMVLVNDTQGFINTKPHPLSSQTLFIESQLYVPLKEVIQWLGLSISQTGSRWVIAPPSLPNTPRVSSPTPPTAHRSLAVGAVPSVSATPHYRLPPLTPSPSSDHRFTVLTAQSGGMVPSVSSWVRPPFVRVSQGVISMNRTWWVSLEPWVDKSQRTGTHWVGQWGSRSLKWPLTTRIPSGNGAVVWAHEGSHWIGVDHLSTAMGLGWQVNGQRIEWIQSIDGLRWGTDDPPSLMIMGQLPIKRARIQPTPSGFQVVIPQATTRLKQWDGVTGDIKRVQIRSSHNQVIITVVTQGNLDYDSCQALPNGCGIKPIGQLTRLAERSTATPLATGNPWVIELEGKGLPTPHIWRHQTRWVVDFNRTRIRCVVPTGTMTSGSSPPYTGIRLGQFSMVPPMARLVLDGSISANVTWHPTTTGGRLHVSMGNNAPRPAPPPVATISAPFTPSKSLLPLRNLVVVIDPGHGGRDPGGIAANGLYEKELTIQLSRRVKADIERLGGRVVMCRENDENPSLQERCDIAHRAKGDLLISVHINSFFHPFASGTETYYYKPSDKPLSYLIHQRMTGVLGFRNNGLKRARMYVLRNTSMPATLIEPGFITNPMEFDRLIRADVQQKLAQAIVQGVVDYVALPKDQRVSD